MPRLVDATANFLAAVARGAREPGGASSTAERLLALVPQATDWYSSVGVAGPDGRVYCETGAGRHAADVGRVEASWFQRAQEQRGFVLGEFGAGPLSGMDVLVGSHPVRAGARGQPAVLFAALDVQQLRRRWGFPKPTRTRAS